MGAGAEIWRQGSGLFVPRNANSHQDDRQNNENLGPPESSGEVRRKTVKSSNFDQLASLEAVPTRVLTELRAGRIESEPLLR